MKISDAFMFFLTKASRYAKRLIFLIENIQIQVIIDITKWCTIHNIYLFIKKYYYYLIN